MFIAIARRRAFAVPSATPSSTSLSCDCAEDELALLPPPPWFVRKLLVAQPYPIIGEDAEANENFICFGP